MLKGATPQEQLQNKLSTEYGVKGYFDIDTKADAVEFMTVQDVDMSKRLVKFVYNTPMYLDSDLDVIMIGAGKKSYKERGPESKSTAKIKPLKNHNMDLVDGKFTFLGEEEITYGGRTFMAATAIKKLSGSTLGQDQLIDYQEGNIDNHSFGFVYEKIKMVERKAAGLNDEWDRIVGESLNPKAFDDKSYFFKVSEYQMFEASSVAFGANSLTPYLGVKSGNKEGIKSKLIDRMTRLQKALASGTQSDEHLETFDLHIRQIKQMIIELTPHMNFESGREKALEISTPEPVIVAPVGIDYAALAAGLRT